MQWNKFLLADLVTRIEVTQAYVDNCVAAHAAGELTAIDAAKAKWWTAQVQNEVLDHCVQLHGGYGFMTEYRAARAWMDARVTKIWAGSNEIMKELIGRDLGCNFATAVDTSLQPPLPEPDDTGASPRMSVLDKFSLTDRVVIVTGASSGLGVAFAKAAAEAGADVVLAARRVDKLEDTAKLVRDAGREALCVATDIVDPAQAQNMVDAAMEKFGRVDVLVNNAGVGTAVPATRETPDQFRAVIDINLNGSYWAAQACGRVMLPGSSIVNISSILGLTTAGLPQAAYAASKAGVVGLTRDLAQQWGTRKGIRVNAIAPGFFKSEMTDQYNDGYLDAMAPRLILGRMGDPEELAATMVWLASEAGGYVTGQTIAVDGGITIT